MQTNLLLLAEVQGGGYISLWKTALVLVVLLLWGRLLTWADKDAPAAHLPRIPLNMGMMVGLIAGFALMLYLPNFLIAFGALLGIMLVEVGVYLGFRKQKVGLDDLGEQFNEWVRSLTERKGKPKDIPNQVTIIQKSGAPLTAPEEEGPERAAFAGLQDALVEPMQKEAEQIELAPSDGQVAVRYWVDGVPYVGRTLDRTIGSDAVTMLKGAAGLDVENKRKPQRGNIRFSMEGKKKEFRLDTAGTTAGERASLLLDPKKRHDFKVETLGFTPRQLEQVKSAIKTRTGIVLVAAPKDQGLTSLLYGLLAGHDAFIEHIHTIERDPDIELTGITQNKLPAGAPPAEELKVVDWVASQEPDVISIDKVEEPRTAQNLVDFSKRDGNRMVYVGMRAGSATEALAQWRKLVGNDKAAMETVVLVIAGRVVRRLCAACKVGYAPDPNTLRKLNMDPQNVQTLYQARTEPLRDPKGNPIACAFCNDLRFKGRTGVFETMVVDDDFRNAVVTSGGSDAQLKAAFRKQKGRYLQEEALGLVEQGETSVQEVLRVLKGGGETAAPPAAGGGAPPPSSGGGAPVPRTPRSPAAPSSRATTATARTTARPRPG